MAKKKINDDTLLQLIRDGNSPAEAARRLGVGRAAVSKRLKALKIGVTRGVTLRSAAKLVDRESRNRFTSPGKCPRCKGEHIQDPEYSIECQEGPQGI
ncbi:MAG: hypothetical protein ACLQVJ_14560 [Syntrophobacteraceae bacterium]